MTRLITLAAVLVLALGLPGTAAASPVAVDEPAGGVVAEVAIVRAADGSLRTQRIELGAPTGATLDGGGQIVALVPDVEVRGANDIELVGAGAIRDLDREEQGYLDIVGFESVWSRHDGRDVVVAIVDSGVDVSHEDLAGGQIVVGECYLGGGGDSSPCTPSEAASTLHPHGTGVASLVAATTGNGLGLAGAAPGVELRSIRVLDGTNTGGLPDVVAGILAAGRAGADVINLSLQVSAAGLSAEVIEAVRSAFQVAIDEVTAQGSFVVAASGNYGASGNPVVFPASLPNVLAVGSVVEPGVLATTSSTGPFVDVVAPGVNLWTAGSQPGPPYRTNSGTSFAAPLVSAQAAILIGARPDATPGEVTSWITSTALDAGAPGRDDLFGHGLIDPGASLGAAGVGAPSRLDISAVQDGENTIVTWAGGSSMATDYVVTVDGSPTAVVPAVATGTTLSTSDRTHAISVQERVHYLVTSDDGPVRVPPSPTLAVEVSGTTAEITWAPRGSVRIEAYELFRDGLLLGTFGSGVLSFTDRDLPIGSTPSYQVMAVGRTARAVSPVVEAVVPEMPGLPAVFTVNRDGGEVDLAWTDPTGTVDAIDIVRDTTVIATVTGDARSYRDTAPPLGVTVDYSITVRGPLGSETSSPVSVVAAVPPSPPAVSARPTLDGPELSWASTGGTITSWEVRRDGLLVAVVDVGVTSFVDIEAPAEQTVVYVVTAVGPFEAASTDPLSVVVAVVPVAPTAITAEREGAEVRLTWDPPAGTVDTISILRDGGELARLSPTAVEFVDATPPLGVSVGYAVVVSGPLGTVESAETFVIAAAPPVAPSVSAVQSGRNVVLSWIGAGGTITGFRIERNGVEVASLPAGADRFTDRQVPEGVALVYTVTAVGPYEEAVSTAESVTVAFAIALDAFAARQVGAAVELTWSISGTVSAVTILRDGAEIAQAGADSTGFVDVTAPPHVVSTYTVVVDGPLGSVTSSPLSLRVVFDPVAPGGVAASRDGAVISLTWGEPEGTVDSLRLVRNGELVVELPVGDRSFVDSSPPLGVELRYIVEAVGPRGIARSAPIETLAALPPTAPIVQVAPIFDNDVEVTWEGATGTIQYVNVLRNDEVVAELAPGTRRYVDFLEAPDEGAELRYRVVAVGFYGEDASSGEAAIVVARPVRVATFTAGQVGDAIEVKWTVVGTVTRVELRRDDELIAVLDPSETVFVDPDAPRHQRSTYTLTAVGPLETVVSPAAAVLLAFRPVAPEFVAATFILDSRQVQVVWGEIDGTVDGIDVLRDGAELVSDLPSDVRSYVDSSPQPGVRHRYQLRLVGPRGTVLSSAVEVEAAAPPVAPALITTRQFGTSVEVSWSSPAGTVSELSVYRDGELMAVLLPGTSSFIDGSAPPHVESRYRVVVRGPLGEDESGESAIRLVFDPVAPAVLQSSVGAGVVSLSWSAPGGTVDEIIVRRNGVALASLDSTGRSFVDTAPPSGTAVRYDILVRGPLGQAVSPVVAVATLMPATAPVVLEAAAGPGRLDLTWAEPDSDGGSAVSTYVIDVRSAGLLLQRLTTPGRTATFVGLPRGVTVEYSVSAVTEAGSGLGAVGSIRIPATGYWMLAEDGSVYAFGESADRTSVEVLAPARTLMDPTDTAIAFDVTASGAGLVVLYESGAVVALGDATDHGALDVALDPGETPASISLTPGGGYWIFTDRGRVVARGSAPVLDDLFSLTDPAGVPIGRRLNGPIIASVGTPTGLGYYLVASDGGVFAFGDAVFRGSMGGIPLNQPVVGLAPTPDNGGYWLVAADGGVFAFNAPFRGSLPGILAGRPLNAPVNGLVPSGSGYLMAASDGGVFAFGSDVDFEGSLGGQSTADIVDIAALR